MDNYTRGEKGLSLIVPAYNEGKNVGKVLGSLLKFFRERTINHEIIVVNDGSNDDSLDVVADYPIKLINHTVNKGYGSSLKDGIKASKYEYVIFFDADNQHRVDYIQDIFDKLLNADAVIGQRGMAHSQTLYRITGKAFLSLFIFILLGIKMVDLNCGLRGFRKSVITRYLHLLPNGFSASMTSTLIMLFRKYNVEYIPVIASKRTGASKLREVRDGLRTLNQILRMAMLFVPWRFFGSIGFLFIFVGFIYGVNTYHRIRGFPASAVMLIVAGVISIFFGLLMDQIAEIRKEKLEN